MSKNINMLKSIEIKNYKNIKYLKIDNLKKINVFTGAQSVGKTNVLEAIFLASSGNINIFNLFLQNRNLNVVGNSIYNSFFIDNNIKEDILFNLEFEKEKLNLRVHEANGQIAMSNNSSNSSTKLNPNIKLSDKEVFITRTWLGNKWKGKFFVPKISIDLELSDYLQADKEEEFFQIIKSIEPSIQDMKFIGNDLFLKRKDSQNFLSVNLFGEGLKLISEVILKIAIYSEKGGYSIFIDEFENGIHYQIMPKYIEALYELCKIKNIQLFLTTHSKDFLDSLKDCYKKESKFKNIFNINKLFYVNKRKEASNYYLTEKSIVNYPVEDLEKDKRLGLSAR